MQSFVPQSAALHDDYQNMSKDSQYDGIMDMSNDTFPCSIGCHFDEVSASQVVKDDYNIFRPGHAQT